MQSVILEFEKAVRQYERQCNKKPLSRFLITSQKIIYLMEVYRILILAHTVAQWRKPPGSPGRYLI